MIHEQKLSVVSGTQITSFYFFHRNMACSSSLNCWPYRVGNRGPLAVGGKRFQAMFPCSGGHIRQASEGSCSNSGKSPRVSAPAPRAALRAHARTWLGALLLPSCALAYFQMFHAAACGVLSGSVLLDVLSCSFLSLCFPPAAIKALQPKNYVFLITWEIP